MTGSAPFPVATIVSEPFDENSYVAHLPGRKDCVVVDPGFEPDLISRYLESQGLTPAAILITHGHSDHIAGNDFLKRRWPTCPLVIGHGDAAKLTRPELNLSAMFGARLSSPPADVLLREGEQYAVAGFRFDVREIPGHSSGHIVLIEQQHQPAVIFGGDVLFAGSIGRTDFPDGSFAALARGIRDKLFVLADDSIVYPGHGPATTIGRERRSNPYVGDQALQDLA